MWRIFLIPVFFWVVMFAACSMFVPWTKNELKDIAKVITKGTFTLTVAALIITLFVIIVSP